MKPLTWLLAGLLVVAGVVAGILTTVGDLFESERAVVVHWTTGHPTRDGLLKQMAEEFNEAGHAIGRSKIVVEV